MEGAERDVAGRGGGVRRWACWGKVRGSNHRVSGEEEGANKQQSRRKSDKDGIDSRTTGRAECDKEENDVRDKAEWHKCHHANLSCTLPLSPLYFASVPPLLPDPKPGGDAHQMGSMEDGSRPPATNFPHLTASTVSRHQLEPSQPGLRLHSWGWTGQSATPEEAPTGISLDAETGEGHDTTHHNPSNLLSVQLSLSDSTRNEIGCSDAWAMVWSFWTHPDLSTGYPVEITTPSCAPQSRAAFSDWFVGKSE